MQTQLRSLLMADATVSANCGTRVDWAQRPQGKGLPAITLTMINDSRDQTLSGLQTTQGPLVQVDVWANDYATLATIREAVITVLTTPAVQSGVRFLGAQNVNALDLNEETDLGPVYRSAIRSNIWNTIP